MPAIVPPGFTRGPILFIGPTVEPEVERSLLQAFWQQAGGYGARILIIACQTNGETDAAHRYAETFQNWEADTVETLAVSVRADALDPTLGGKADASTAILLVGDHPLRLAATLGGTPLAQAVRRANARSKVVCAYGPCAPFLSQHMMAPGTGGPNAPVVHAGLVQFAPGLGLINRILIDVHTGEEAPLLGQIPRLITGVAHNPFLIGLGLGRDTAAVVLPDDTVTILGEGNAIVVDGEQIAYSTLHSHDRALQPPHPESVFNLRLHLLAPGDTFVLDTRTPGPRQDTDLPAPRPIVTSVF